MVAHQNQKGMIDGIYCDLCGEAFVNKFEYYSARIDLVEVDREVAKQGIKDVDRRNLDLDICIKCMDLLKKKVLDNIAAREKKEEDSKKKGVWTVKS